MNCSEAKKIIHAYLDGELDATHSLGMESHLRECAGCARLLQEQRLLKSTLGESAMQFKMPPGVRRSVIAELRQSVRPERRSLFALWWSPWFAGAATAVIVGLSVIFIGANMGRSSSQHQLMAQITSSHVRSMMANHLMDVVSTDQHTVKPWFDGKVDFAPPVKNFTEQGFPLAGGRLEYLDDHQVAALVYMRQKHIINVFIWPSNAPAHEPGAAMTHNGYHLVNWTESGMTFWAVSDLNEKELQQLVEMLRKN